jgi:hypothetical protein
MKNLYRWSMLIVARLLVPEGSWGAVRPSGMVFVRLNHSSVAITKRYLGIRQQELLETYSLLVF